MAIVGAGGAAAFLTSLLGTFLPVFDDQEDARPEIRPPPQLNGRLPRKDVKRHRPALNGYRERPGKARPGGERPGPVTPRQPPKRRRNLDKRRGSVASNVPAGYTTLPRKPAPPLQVQTGYAQVTKARRRPQVQEEPEEMTGPGPEEPGEPDLEAFCKDASPLKAMSDEQLRPIFWELVAKHNIPLTKSMMAGGNEEGDLEGLLIQDRCMVLSMSIDDEFGDSSSQFHHRKAEKPEESLELPFLDRSSEEVNDVIDDDLIITASPEMIRQGQQNQPSEIVVSGGFQFEPAKIGKIWAGSGGMRPGQVVDTVSHTRNQEPPVTPPTLLRGKDFGLKERKKGQGRPNRPSDVAVSSGYQFEPSKTKRKTPGTSRLRPGLVVETVTNAHNLMPPMTSPSTKLDFNDDVSFENRPLRRSEPAPPVVQQRNQGANLRRNQAFRHQPRVVQGPRATEVLLPRAPPPQIQRRPRPPQQRRRYRPPPPPAGGRRSSESAGGTVGVTAGGRPYYPQEYYQQQSSHYHHQQIGG